MDDDDGGGGGYSGHNPITTEKFKLASKSKLICGLNCGRNSISINF